MGTNLVSSLLRFLRKEKLDMTLREISDSEFWLESSDGFLTARFFVNQDTRSILYDIFSPRYDLHLKEETLKDAEKLDSIIEEKGEWEYEKPIEYLWLLLDAAKLWAQKNGFRIKETRLI
jgi:hypothetical protein